MLVFDINDFDETFPGPWEWDIKRLGASLILAARDRGFSKTVAKQASCAAAASYRERMAEFAEMRVLDAWYSKVKHRRTERAFPEQSGHVNPVVQEAEAVSLAEL